MHSFFESPSMRVFPIVLATCATALSLLSPAAGAFTCYMLYDRNDNLVYRDTISPVDMSDQGASARESMRDRGDYLVVADADRCPQVTFVFGAAGSTHAVGRFDRRRHAGRCGNIRLHRVAIRVAAHSSHCAAPGRARQQRQVGAVTAALQASRLYQSSDSVAAARSRMAAAATDKAPTSVSFFSST